MDGERRHRSRDVQWLSTCKRVYCDCLTVVFTINAQGAGLLARRLSSCEISIGRSAWDEQLVSRLGNAVKPSILGLDRNLAITQILFTF